MRPFKNAMISLMQFLVFSNLGKTSALPRSRDEVSLPGQPSSTPSVPSYQGPIGCIAQPTLDSSEEQYNATSDYLNEWIASLVNDTVKFHQYLDSSDTIFQYFGNEHWGSNNMDCSIGEECKYLPSCSEVKDFQIQHRGDRTDEEIERDANKIFLATLQMHALHRFARSSYVAMESARNSVGLISDQITVDFTRQPDAAKELTCELAKFTSNILFAVTDMAIAMEDRRWKAGKFFLDLIPVPEMGAITDLIDMGRYGSQQRYSDVKFFFNFANTITDMSRKKYQLKQAQAESVPNDTDQPRIYQSYTFDECAAKGDNNFKNTASMKSFVQERFDTYRDGVGKLWSNIIHPTTAEMAFETAHWLRMVDRNVGHMLKMKQIIGPPDMTKNMASYLISAAWRGSHCYQTCQQGGEFHASCRGSDSRWCPNVNEICQAECWTTLKSNNHETPLYGLNELEKWNVTAIQMMNGSYQSYVSQRNRLVNPMENPEAADWLKFNDPLGTTLQLPTCRSRNVVVSALEKKQGQNFPCTCGDWMSSDSRAFLNSISMGEKSADYQQGWAQETFRSICLKNISKLPPLTHFFATCGLGVTVPDRQMKRHPYCDPLRNHVKQQHWAEQEANFEFCKNRSWGEAYAVRDHNKNSEYSSRCSLFVHGAWDWRGYVWSTETDYE